MFSMLYFGLNSVQQILLLVTYNTTIVLYLIIYRSLTLFVLVKLKLMLLKLTIFKISHQLQWKENVRNINMEVSTEYVY